jgi:hypothetical protein
LIAIIVGVRGVMIGSRGGTTITRKIIKGRLVVGG